MKIGYYTLPLDFAGMLQSKAGKDENNKPDLNLRKTHLVKKAVDEFLELIITTHLGEFKYDGELGFEIWDIEFENIQIDKFNTHNFPKQNLEKALRARIQKFEPRLKDTKVEILFIHGKVFKGKKIKYFVDITVKGKLTDSNEDYSKTFQFGMGPFFK